MILRKIIKIAATRCHILKLKCTKFDFGWGSAPDTMGELTVLPRPLAGFKGPTSKGRGGEGTGRKGKGGERRAGQWRAGEGAGRERRREGKGEGERRDRGRGGRGRRMGFAHPLFSA